MARKRSVFLPSLQLVLKRIAQIAVARVQRCSLKLAAYVILFAIVLLGAVLTPTLAQPPLPAAITAPTDDLLQQGRAQFQAGQFAAAIATLQQAVQTAKQQGDFRRQAAALNNLGYVQFETGQAKPAAASWQQAAALSQQTHDTTHQIRYQLNQAEALQALGESRSAIALLTQITAALANQPASLEQARGLRSLGNALLAVGGTLDEPRSIDPQALFRQSLQIATQLQSAADISAASFSLGNFASAQLRNTVRLEIDTNQAIDHKITAATGLLPQILAALQFYQAAIAQADTPPTIVQAQLGQLNLLVSSIQVFTRLRSNPDAVAAASNLTALADGMTQLSTYILALVPQILPQLDALPVNRVGVYTRINFANTLVKLKHDSTDSSPLVLFPLTEPIVPQVIPQAAQILATAIQQARRLGDQRAEAYALGSLGSLYERTQQWQDAEQVTQQALFLAQANNAPDIAYQWQWQLARIFRQQPHKTQAALESYRISIKTLEPLRRNLVAVNQDVQFDFRDSVAPLYRQFVELLLQPSDGAEISQANLKQARQQIENLQLAELDNYFREACLAGQEVQLDQLAAQNPTTAFIYPIVLNQRLQVIAKIPQQSALRYHTNPLPADLNLDKWLGSLRQQLTDNSTYEDQETSGQLYQWLIAPFEADLQAQKVDTLVFVLDGKLRDVPMAALYNTTTGRYLIQDYAIALSPALQLLDPKPVAQQQLNVLAAGLIEEMPDANYGPLKAVPRELAQIEATQVIHYPPLLEKQFSIAAFSQALNANPFNAIHLATHGNFSSRKNSTYLLAHDGYLTLDRLGAILRDRQRSHQEAIELLVLSACSTAEGDDRASLGLAGLAIKAGARSTMASLWTVVDDSSPILIGKFYAELANARTTKVTKAKALQTAQLELFKAGYADPRFWAPYVLVGNWL